jgi:sporulation-control protein spo0M
MSFFGKIKQGLGIGTASLELAVPGQVARDSGEVKGRIVLIGKSEQRVKSIKVRMIELYTTGQGEEKKTKEYVLGEVPVHQGDPFVLKADEKKEIEFTLPFTLKLSGTQALAEKGGALGMLGKAASFAASEKSVYQIRANADLDGVALDPNDTRPVKLV